MDKLLIRNFELHAAVGVSAAEREVGQRLLITLEAEFDLRPAGQSDALDDTISYAALAETVHAIVTQGEWKLLEALAEQLCEALLAAFPVASIRLQVLKRPPPLALPIEAAGIEIVRTRGQG